MKELIENRCAEKVDLLTILQNSISKQVKIAKLAFLVTTNKRVLFKKIIKSFKKNQLYQN